MTQQIPYDENEMTFAFQQGREEGFDFFFREMYPSLCFFANRIIKDHCEAEDIVSGAFMKIWARHEKFDKRESIRAYLYQIIRNDCFQYFQKKGRGLILEKEIHYMYSRDSTPDIEKDIIAAEFLRELYNGFSHLPSQCSQVFTMLYIEGKTVKNIAKELGLSESTIKTQKARGLLTLRKKIIPLSLILIWVII